MQTLAALALGALLGARILSASDDPLAHGELLLGELGCTACHEATPAIEARLQRKSAPRLDEVGKRVSSAWIERFLLDPQAVKAGASMPQVLDGLPPESRAEVAAALTQHLVATTGAFEDEAAAARWPDLEAGRQLYHHVGCVACHEPQEEAWELELGFDDARAQRAEAARDGALTLEGGADDEDDDEPALDQGLPPVSLALGDLARKWSVGSLAAFLLDPLATRPSGRMPALALSEDEARSIALYLLRDQAFDPRTGPERFPGVVCDYYEEHIEGPVPDFSAFEPTRSTVVTTLSELPEHRDDFFGFRFAGELRIDEPGLYSFSTTSDDGSRLYVDGALVVENDGDHAPHEKEGAVQLDAGWHALEVTMYEKGGGELLEVRWSGPGIAEGEIPSERLSYSALAYRALDAQPLRLDRAQVKLGTEWFQRLRCASCHESESAGLAAHESTRAAKSLAELDPAAAGGCLGQAPTGGATHYALTDAERVALRGVLVEVAALEQSQPPARELALAFERMRCNACHSRAGVGGPATARRPYFVETGAWDVGDQGRFPPHLDEPGSKLTPAWLEAVLFESGTSRGYVATRMPQFGRANLERFPELFRVLDAKPDDMDAPGFELTDVEHGRRLAGKRGLGCIQCHEFSGHPSLGIPAVDLARVRERVQPGWFARLLRDPVGINMNTRMPEFWVQGKSPVADVYDGEIEKQIDALWTYLSLGSSMPLPEGLAMPDEAFELVVGDDPRTVGVFMQGVSPRTLCVGFPAGTHYAYDMQDARLAKVWRGRFFNARGTWEGRAGALEVPPSMDVLDLPTRPMLARLASSDAAWPRTNAEQAGFRVLGRRFDEERRPVFRYALGDVVVEELVYPEIRAGGSWIVQEVQLDCAQDPPDVYYFLGEIAPEREPGDVLGAWNGGNGAHDIRVDPAVIYTAGAREFERQSRPQQADMIGRIGFQRMADGTFRAKLRSEFTW